jgi:type II secretion system protein N
MIGLAGFAPWDLLANRYLFPRLEKRTSISLEAGTVRPGLPWSIVLEDVTVRTSGRQAVAQPVETLRATPALSWLWGDRGATVDAALAGGTLEIEWQGDAVRFDGRDLELKNLPLLASLSPWKLGGRARIEGEIASPAEKPAAGGVTWTFEDATAEGIGFPGLELPRLELGKFEGELKIANSRVEFARARASGGTSGLEITGGVTLVKPASNSPVGLHLALTPSPAFIAGLGGKAPLFERIRKPDGTIRIVVEGTLAAPRTGLE